MLQLGHHTPRTEPHAAHDVADTPAIERSGVRVDLGRVTHALRLTVEVLVVGTFFAQLLKVRGVGLGVARFIDADVKVNLPTGFKVFALAASALLAWAVGRAARATGDRWAARWTHMAVVLGFLMVDEMAYVHQSLASFMGRQDGIFHYSWVLIYLPAAAVVAVRFLPFVASLRRDLQTRLVLAGVLFAGGSGGVELVKSLVVHSSGEESAGFYFTTAVSDSLEMIGLAVLIVALLTELARRTESFELRLAR